MANWLKYLLGALGTLIGGIITIFITWIKLRHNKKEREKDRIHEKEIIKLQHINNKELKEMEKYSIYVFYNNDKDMINFNYTNIKEKWEKIRIEKNGVKNEK